MITLFIWCMINIFALIILIRSSNKKNIGSRTEKEIKILNKRKNGRI